MMRMFGLCLLFTLGLFLADTASMLGTYGSHGFARLVRGGLAGLFLAAVGGTAVALPLSILYGLVPAPARSPVEAARRWLCVGSADQHAGRVGTVLGMTILAGGYGVSLFFATLALLGGVVQPRFQALGVVGLSLGMLTFSALVLGPSRRLIGAIAARLAPARVLGWPLRSAGRALGCLGAMGLVAVCAVLVHFWEIFAHLPWSVVLRLGAAALFVALARWLGPRLEARRVGRSRLVALGALAGLAAVGAGFVAAQGLRPEDYTSRQIAFREGLAAQLGGWVLHAVADFDGDGHLSFFGGGDCAPFDPTRHPSAVEVPNNGIDEDCDGADLSADAGVGFGRANWPVSASVPHRPPIVLITVDALSARHLGVNGYSRGVTPNIDRLARASAHFANAYAQGPSTRLSFPALFTSRFDSELPRRVVGRHPFSLDCTDCQLAEMLQSAGYDTAAVLPDNYFSRSNWQSITNGFARVDLSAVPAGLHNAPLVTDAAIARVRTERGIPLFLWVHYYDAHAPHRQPDGVPALGNTAKDRYDAELQYVDSHVGRLLDAIEAYMPEALIVLTSDHATSFHPNPGTRRAHYGYDLHTSTLHVPLIFRAPSIPASRVDGLVSLLDVTPTVLNLLRLGGDRQLRGESLVPELLDGVRDRRRRTFHQFFVPEARPLTERLRQVGVRTDRHHLLFDVPSAQWKLYDYRADYYEIDNLLESSTPPEEFSALRAVVQAYVHEMTPE